MIIIPEIVKYIKLGKSRKYSMKEDLENVRASVKKITISKANTEK
jgi:hypothetical protein